MSHGTRCIYGQIFDPEFTRKLIKWLDKAPVEMQRKAKDVIFELADLLTPNSLCKSSDSGVCLVLEPRRVKQLFSWMAFTVRDPFTRYPCRQPGLAPSGLAARDFDIARCVFLSETNNSYEGRPFSFYNLFSDSLMPSVRLFPGLAL